MTADAKVDSMAFLNTMLKQKPFVYAPPPPSPFTTAIKPFDLQDGMEIASKKPKVLHLKATFGHDVYTAKQYVRLTLRLDSGWKTVQFFDGDEFSIYLADL